MATITDRVTGKVPYEDVVGKRSMLTATIDATDSSLTSIGAGDIVLLMPLVKGQIVQMAQLVSDVIEDSTATADVGIVTWAGGTASAVDVDADGFLDGVNLETTAGTMFKTLEANTLDQGYLVPNTTSYLAFTAVDALDTFIGRVFADVVTPEPSAV